MSVGDRVLICVGLVTIGVLALIGLVAVVRDWRAERAKRRRLFPVIRCEPASPVHLYFIRSVHRKGNVHVRRPLFAQVPPSGGIFVKAGWLRRVAMARFLFDRAVQPVAGTRRVGRLREWAYQERDFQTRLMDDGMSAHLRLLDDLSFNKGTRNLIATFILHRKLHRAVCREWPEEAADVRTCLAGYPEYDRTQGRMLYLLTTGIIIGVLAPADRQFVLDVAKEPDPVLPRHMIERSASTITPQPGTPSAA